MRHESPSHESCRRARGVRDASALRLPGRFLRLRSRTIAALCGAWLLPALLTAQTAQGGGWAKGTLSVGGRTFELRHAVVATDGALGNVYLSDVPLTTATIANFARMGELGKSGALHALYVKVILRHREVSGIEVWDRAFPNGSVFAWKGDLGAHELAAVAGDHVSGRARARSPVDLEGVPVTFDVEYDAIPAPAEAVSPGALHRWPTLERARDAVSAWADRAVTGPNIAISFFGLVGLILIWIFVLVPRQTARAFRILETERGYRPVAADDPDLAATLRRLAPILPQGGVESGREDPALNVSRAIALSLPAGIRFLTRSWCTVPRSHVARTSNELLFYHHVVELRSLPFTGEVFVIGKGVGWPFRWLPGRDLVLGVREIQGGGTPEFGELYSVCAPGGVETAIPLPLQQALVELAERMVLRHVQLGGPWLGTMNMRFTPNGWGVCCEQVIGRKRLLALVDTADRIGTALDASYRSRFHEGGHSA
jgi:hypothetical protein